jgi:hypothetical protein
MPGFRLAGSLDRTDNLDVTSSARSGGLDGSCLTIAVGKGHKRVQWRTPAGGKRRPGVIDATRNELVRCLEQRRGSVWLRISRYVAVAGYPADRALNRVRSLRSDGAESLLAMIVAMLYLADVRTGFIGKPRAERGPWQRYTLHDLAQLAYGAQAEADLRRARRSLDMLVSLGWAFPTKQVRRYVDPTTFRSEPAVRRLNLHRLCKMTGTSWLLTRDRQHADHYKREDTASFESRPQWCESASQENPRTTREALPRRYHALSTGDPAAGATRAAQALSTILDLLGNG